MSAFVGKVISHLHWRSGPSWPCRQSNPRAYQAETHGRECQFAMFDNGEIGPKVLQTERASARRWYNCIKKTFWKSFQVTNHDVFVIIVRNDVVSEAAVTKAQGSPSCADSAGGELLFDEIVAVGGCPEGRGLTLSSQPP